MVKGWSAPERQALRDEVPQRGFRAEIGGRNVFTLAQETLRLKLAMEGYRQVVLLKHDLLPVPFDLSSADERLADVIVAPTRANLFAQLTRLANEGYLIDLWIFSHGTPGAFVASAGQHGSVDLVGASEIAAALGRASTGLDELPIRMVWSTLCYGASLNGTWRAVGAKVVSGSRAVNFYPNQFGRFATAWNSGMVDYQEALGRADTAVSRTLVQTYLATMDAPAHREEWGGCPIGRHVLGDHPCAKAYFTRRWGLTEDEWDDSLSGKDNMHRSSARIVAGQGTLTKSDTPTWG
jgi:hypothetical protein